MFRFSLLISMIAVFGLFSQSSYSEEQNILDQTANYIESWDKGEKGVHKEIARPISKEVLKRAGQPGFYISKYMNYRKLIGAPRCTTSESLSYYANLLTLAGDVTLNVITWKQNKELKEEFTARLGEIEDYSNAVDLTKTTEKNLEKPDVQLMAFDYNIKKEKQALERFKILQYFKYPALSMHLVATILNAQEALAEGSSLGAATAAVNACANAQKVNTQIETKATDAITEVAPTSKDPKATPWYLKPFVWLGEQFKALKQSSFGQATKKALDTRSEYKKGLRTDKVQGDYNYTDAAGTAVQGMGPANSAAYAEEMIVGVITQLKKTKNETKTGVLNKLGQDLEVMAIRYAVRTLVKANIETVDKFMRTPTGRAVVYAYNIWVIYTEFDDLRDQIAETKARINKLSEIRAKLVGSRDVKDSFKYQNFKWVTKIINNILSPVAFAELIRPNNFRLCLGTNNCPNAVAIFDQQTHNYFSKLPPEIQNAQQALIKQSYTINQINPILNGKKSLLDLRLDMINKEIDKNQNLVEQYYKMLNDKKIIKYSELASYQNKTLNEDYKVYAPLMREDFASQKIFTDSEQVNLLNLNNSSGPSKKMPMGDQGLHMNSNSDLSPKQYSLKEEAPAEGDVIINNIHEEDKDIWGIIHNRYIQHFQK